MCKKKEFKIANRNLPHLIGFSELKQGILKISNEVDAAVFQ